MRLPIEQDLIRHTVDQAKGTENVRFSRVVLSDICKLVSDKKKKHCLFHGSQPSLNTGPNSKLNKVHL